VTPPATACAVVRSPSSNALVRSKDQLVAVIGLKDVVVVAIGDAVLVADHSQTDKVKKLVERLKAQGHPEATEHRGNYRPWGYYRSIDQGSRTRSNALSFGRAAALSAKAHHRAGHWVVVRGAAEATLNGKIEHVHENESIYLPIGSTHRLANPGKIDLELSRSRPVGEDDIFVLKMTSTEFDGL
jgi:mannose-1-phosphate guanylyltransferase/mannose-6-phosphate isomerase